MGPTTVICLITDSPATESMLRFQCPPPSVIQPFPLRGLVNTQHELADHGRSVVAAAADATVVLVEWRLDQAPVINTLGYHLRRVAATPLVALCRDGSEQVAALATGADDALTLPVTPAGLQARQLAYRRLVAAVAEQQGPAAPGYAGGALGPAHDLLQYGDLRIDRTAHRFYIKEREVEVTPREFALLSYLIQHPDVVCSRDQILDHVWGLDFDTGTNMVDVYMHFLRRKLEAHGLRKNVIQTVRGVGYRLSFGNGPADAADG